ncbi:uncharacterized protein LOC114342832 [Diabrotica virgifera virgifera]|uniref:TTF-type domain-containing protein n=1 Tax=Diabrotica virgifera virgifera TaxID=50390 RepID=A0ABM5IYH7_DIAVI|nr:uncharacterized protein LOC114342832 [Diabrotica virgifera virgifera]
MDKFIIKKPRLDIESEGESRSINVATCSNDFSNPSTSQATTTSCSSFQGCLKTQVEVEGLVFAKNDIGHFVGVSNISDADKITLLRRVWEPLPSHKFCVEIIGSKKRTFQVKWLQRFPWLAYSDKLKGAFCKLCVVFCPSAVGSGYHESPENLVKKAFRKWKDAIEVFQKHSRTKYHQHSSIAKDEFFKVFDGQQQNVIQQLQKKK